MFLAKLKNVCIFCCQSLRCEYLLQYIYHFIQFKHSTFFTLLTQGNFSFLLYNIIESNMNRQCYWLILSSFCPSKNETITLILGDLHIHCHFAKMIEEEKRRLLKDNLSLFSRLLMKNNSVEFQKQLNDNPNYTHLRCCNEYGVSSYLSFSAFFVCRENYVLIILKL